MLGDVHITTCDFELLSTCAAYVTGLGDKDFRRVRNAEELFARFLFLHSSPLAFSSHTPLTLDTVGGVPHFLPREERGKRKEGEKLA